ncbi:TonB dependent receptor [Komagataeibacter europaeus]|uniref:TonB dependent receptor n=1 Tax=Komagataeibacter europaeus TaxID=33995 RepID=A0A0M0EHG8_KOMEU|nr:TonB-dependent receptor [Komagataeibacter europaeus]KON64381.1 TonB dependent receptor [Komagataeibacter europaeus]
MTARSRCNFRSFLLLTAGTIGVGTSVPCGNANATPVHIASQPMAQALEMLGRQTGENIVFTPQQVANLKAPAVNGDLSPTEAVRRLLGESGLTVESVPNGGFIIHAASPPARGSGHKTGASDHARKDGVNDIERMFVTGHRKSQSEKRTSNIIMDSVAYDPFENLGGVSSVAQSVIQLPGVTAITDGDEPRYVSVRGISPDLNHTTMDGVTIASIGESGAGGTRRVNLQDIPSEMTSRTNVYKSFTAEQDGDAIGGVIDMIPMSAFDHKGLYKYLDAYGIWSSKRGGVGANGLSGYSPHMGEGAKGTFSDTFGKNNEFGIVLSMRYQNRARNTTKNWQSYYYDNPDGGSDSTPDSSWNGHVRPSQYSTGEYANDVTNIGGSGKLEWKPTDKNIYMSLMGWSYARWEHSVMDKEDYNLKDTVTSEDGMNIPVNSMYVRRRQNEWHRQNSGIIGHIDWHRDKHSVLLRAGYTMEDYSDYQPYIAARAYPKGLTANYTGYPNGEYMWQQGSMSNPGAAQTSTWNLYNDGSYQTWEKASERIPTVRLDYGWNTGKSASGFGVMSGFQWRELTLDHNEEQTYYDSKADFSSQMLQTSHVPWLNTYSETFIGPNGYTFPWSKLTVDQKKSAYNSGIANYKYRENIFDGYVSLHYAWKNTVLIAGVRADATNYAGWTPQINSAAQTVSSGYTKQPGSYINPLPSFDAVHHFPHDVTVHASYSQSLGRPAPGQIAMAASESCGDDDAGGADCTLTMGNAHLKPRHSHNFDISVDKWFNRGNGMVSLAFFSKWIKDDIITSRSLYSQNGTNYEVITPMNANSAGVKGIEFNIMNRNLHVFSQILDLQANVTWLQGHESYSAGTTTYRYNAMIDQPGFIANGMLTWHIPQIKGALRTTVNYSGKYYTSFGATPGASDGFGKFLTFNLGFWHQVYPGITLKYEVMNLANYQPTYMTGDHLQYADERDNYGHAVYFHVVFN